MDKLFSFSLGGILVEITSLASIKTFRSGRDGLQRGPRKFGGAGMFIILNVMIVTHVYIYVKLTIPFKYVQFITCLLYHKIFLKIKLDFWED